MTKGANTPHKTDDVTGSYLWLTLPRTSSTSINSTTFVAFTAAAVLTYRTSHHNKSIHQNYQVAGVKTRDKRAQGGKGGGEAREGAGGGGSPVNNFELSRYRGSMKKIPWRRREGINCPGTWRKQLHGREEAASTLRWDGGKASKQASKQASILLNNSFACAHATVRGSKTPPGIGYQVPGTI